MTGTSDERLNELEGRYLHLENVVEQLDEVIVGQRAELDRLAREVASLREQLATASDGEADGGESPPPHY